MITLERGLRHLRWADDAFFAALQARPAQVLAASATASSWTVGQLARHIVEGAQWYRYCLTTTPWTDLDLPTDQAGVLALRTELTSVNGVLVTEAAVPDARVTFADEHGEASAWRSTILTQAMLHSIEHRAQIAVALEVCGFDPIVLDDLDLWAYERHAD